MLIIANRCQPAGCKTHISTECGFLMIQCHKQHAPETEINVRWRSKRVVEYSSTRITEGVCSTETQKIERKCTALTNPPCPSGMMLSLVVGVDLLVDLVVERPLEVDHQTIVRVRYQVGKPVQTFLPDQRIALSYPFAP